MATAPKAEATDKVAFTQYLAPHGRRSEVFIEVASASAAKARAIVDFGYCFECEVLRTGQVSLTITDPQDGYVDIRVVPNGPGVREAVEHLIQHFALTEEV